MKILFATLALLAIASAQTAPKSFEVTFDYYKYTDGVGLALTP